MRKAARVIGSLAFACAIAAGSGAARAQSPAEDVATDGADGAVDSLVESGIELRRHGRDEEALGVFERALERAPDSTRIKVHLAATYQALGRWVEAERYLRVARDQLRVQHPLDADAAYLLGRICEERNDTAQATAI